MTMYPRLGIQYGTADRRGIAALQTEEPSVAGLYGPAVKLDTSIPW